MTSTLFRHCTKSYFFTFLSPPTITLRKKENEPELRGMEDVLAMALAKKHRYKFNIGIIKKHLDWYVNKEKIKDHEEKMKRKRLVYEKYDRIFNGLPSLNVKPL